MNIELDDVVQRPDGCIVGMDMAKKRLQTYLVKRRNAENNKSIWSKERYQLRIRSLNISLLIDLGKIFTEV